MTVQNLCNCNRVSGSTWNRDDCLSCWAYAYHPDWIRGWNGHVAIIGPPPRKAGIVHKITTLAKAIVHHAMNGFPRASKSDAARRMAICKSCGEYDGSTCRQCGCYVAIKATWKDQHCPINKW